MSVSTLFDKNNFQIYVNNITLKNLNLSSDGNYKLKFPPVVPSGIAPLSVLGVDTIVDDLITLKWLEPSESLPFDVINCNILNAQLEINCLGNTTLGYLDAEILNARKVGGTEVSGFLVSPLQVETDIGYFLPPTRPTTNGQVLSSLINGTMSWVDKDISNFQPKSYFIQLPDVTLNSTIPEQDLYFNFNLIDADFYTCIFGGRAVKINPTGTFNFRALATSTNSTNIGLQPFIVIPSNGYVTLGGINQDCGINLNFWAQVTATGNNTIRCRLESDISGAGECLIQNISMLITKIAVNI
jgi:hypothetical protein